MMELSQLTNTEYNDNPTVLVDLKSKLSNTIKLPTPSFPLLVINEDFFYSSTQNDPHLMNAWYRVNGWYRPINVLMPVLWIIWITAVGVYFGLLRRLIARLEVDIIIALLCALQAGFVVYCISCETTDDLVLKVHGLLNIKANRERNLDFVKISGIPVIDADSNYCNICQVHVPFFINHR